MKSSIFIYPDPFFPLFYIIQAKNRKREHLLTRRKEILFLYSWMGRVLLLWDLSASWSPQTTLMRQQAVSSHIFISPAFSRLKKKKRNKLPCHYKDGVGLGISSVVLG